tara:strand:+ start:1374 stop:2810 length:1437 start_codon:yes stop_codon:yes gene_type:complete
MTTINSDCSIISYTGNAVLSDYDGVNSYTIKSTYNDFESTSSNINVTSGSLPNGITGRQSCTGIVNCTCTPVTVDVLGNTIVNYSAPTINPVGFKRGQYETTQIINLSSNSSLMSVSINGVAILITADNLLYSADYDNLEENFSPETNRLLLETALQNAFLASLTPAKVEVIFNNILNSFTLNISYIQVGSTVTIDVVEYLHSLSAPNTITLGVSPTTQTYEWDRLALQILSYDNTITRSSWWTLDNNGITTELVKSSDSYLFYNKRLALTTGHSVKYHVITTQGQYIIYNYQVTALYNTISNIWSFTVVLESTVNGETNIPDSQQYVNIGVGPVVSTTITSCSSSTSSTDSCINYFDITPTFFNASTTSTKFADGIYTFDFIIEMYDGTCIYIRECVFVGCSINCTIIDQLAADIKNQEIIDLVGIYNALLSSNVSNCNLSCSELTDLFTYLTTELNGLTNGGTTTNSTTTTEHCNC